MTRVPRPDSDWGYWLAELFRIDPNMVAGPYDGDSQFHELTQGLYADRTTLDRLADAVGDATPRNARIADVARHHGLDPWLLNGALFGRP